MKKAFEFIGEVRSELSKVTWPTREEAIKLTLMVLLVSGIIGAYVGGLDFAFTKILSLVVSK